MKSWRRLPLLMALMLTPASSAVAGGEADALLADMGRVYYARHCAACHGEAGRGDGPAAAALHTPPADLTRIAARRGDTFDEGEIARFIDGRLSVTAHGSREMPIWGERLGEGIPEAGISESIVRGKLVMLVQYLKSIQHQPASGE